MKYITNTETGLQNCNVTIFAEKVDLRGIEDCHSSLSRTKIHL